MSYNFKSLADVELLNAMPENANIIVEVDGATRRAPKEDGIGKLVSVETLDEVPENATVLVEVDGEIKRVPGKGLGGGTVLEIWFTVPEEVASPTSLDETETVVTSGYFKANMTYAEVLEALENNKLTGAYLNQDLTNIGGFIIRTNIGEIGYVILDGYMDYIVLKPTGMDSEGTFYYWSDNTISGEPPVNNET